MHYSEGLRRLLDELRTDVQDERVLEAIASVPRELFVPTLLASHAYENIALPVGEGQTISQPLIVAIMLDALSLRPEDSVLEVGTGTGYQAALLGRLAARVVTVERIASLADRARENLAKLGATNVTVVDAGPDLGRPAGAPYDAIIVSAAAPAIPPSLLAQLAVNGRLVGPVGTPFDQRLARVVKTATAVQVTWLGPCRFVPLIGRDGWESDAAFSAPPES